MKTSFIEKKLDPCKDYLDGFKSKSNDNEPKTLSPTL